MDFEFLKQYILWDLVIFACLVALVLAGWGIYKLIKRKRPKEDSEKEFLKRVERVLDIKKVPDGIVVYGDLITTSKN